MITRHWWVHPNNSDTHLTQRHFFHRNETRVVSVSNPALRCQCGDYRRGHGTARHGTARPSEHVYSYEFYLNIQFVLRCEQRRLD